MRYVSFLDFHVKIILSGWINHLNFKNGETIHSTRGIRATFSTIATVIVNGVSINFLWQWHHSHSRVCEWVHWRQWSINKFSPHLGFVQKLSAPHLGFKGGEPNKLYQKYPNISMTVAPTTILFSPKVFLKNILNYFDLMKMK
jgi:hypothetical protein